MGYLNSQGSMCKDANAGARRRVFAYRGPSRARLSPVMLTLFPFLFLPDFGNP
jgi:hypothetical protein